MRQLNDKSSLQVFSQLTHYHQPVQVKHISSAPKVSKKKVYHKPSTDTSSRCAFITFSGTQIRAQSTE